jgi:microcystin degradation protein MlrC
MRVAVGGIMHESNTFNQRLTTRRDFEQASLTAGADLVHTWKDAHHEVGGFLEGAGRFGLTRVPTVMAWATPSGPVDDSVIDEVTDRIATACRVEQADGLLLALHGAMVSPRHFDADGEVLTRLRATLGPHFPIIATLDYHANVSTTMAEHATALVGYQTYPHVDQRARGIQAAELMSRLLRNEIQPRVALAKPPLVINLLGQQTDRAPMSTLMSKARALERQPGLLSVSVMAGFPYADVPEMGPAIIAIADGDHAQAQLACNSLSRNMWDFRENLFVECLDPAAAVTQARAAHRRPVVLVDLGDNIGGGSAGDGTVLLAELLRQNAQDAIIVLYDPEAVMRAAAVNLGGTFDAPVGGKTDTLHGAPVNLHGKVHSLHGGTWIETEPRHGGRRHNDQGPTAVIEAQRGIRVVLNSLRTPPFSLGQLTSLGINPLDQQILVVKAAVAYKAAYGPIAAQVLEVDTPGLTAIDPARFTFHHRRRPLFPLDPTGETMPRLS